MVKRFEKYFDAWYVYFTAEPPQFKKKRLWGFEKFVFLIMSTTLGKMYALSLDLLSHSYKLDVSISNLRVVGW